MYWMPGPNDNSAPFENYELNQDTGSRVPRSKSKTYDYNGSYVRKSIYFQQTRNKWVVQWAFPEGKRRTQTFNCNVLGRDEALRQAQAATPEDIPPEPTTWDRRQLRSEGDAFGAYGGDMTMLGHPPSAVARSRMMASRRMAPYSLPYGAQPMFTDPFMLQSNNMLHHAASNDVAQSYMNMIGMMAAAAAVTAMTPPDGSLNPSLLPTPHAHDQNVGATMSMEEAVAAAINGAVFPSVSMFPPPAQSQIAPGHGVPHAVVASSLMVHRHSVNNIAQSSSTNNNDLVSSTLCNSNNLIANASAFVTPEAHRKLECGVSTLPTNEGSVVCVTPPGSPSDRNAEFVQFGDSMPLA